MGRVGHIQNLLPSISLRSSHVFLRKRTQKHRECTSVPWTFTMVWLLSPSMKKCLGNSGLGLDPYMVRTPLIVLYEPNLVYLVNINLSALCSALSPVIAIITATLPQQLSLLCCHLSSKKSYLKRTIDHNSVHLNTVEETPPQEDRVCANLWQTYSHLKAKSW